MTDTEPGSANTAGGTEPPRPERTDDKTSPTTTSRRRRRRGDRATLDADPGTDAAPEGADGAPLTNPPTHPRRPKIGDTRPAPATNEATSTETASAETGSRTGGVRTGGPGTGSSRSGGASEGARSGERRADPSADGNRRRRRRRGQRPGRSHTDGDQDSSSGPVRSASGFTPVELDEDQLEARRGAHRAGKPAGRYLMAVNVQDDLTQIAVLEGRNLIECYLSRPSDDISQIHGNIYLARVTNVLPGMEAAFVDIGTPKNAVLYRGDVVYDPDDVESSGPPRIEDVLKGGQAIICQVTKNPIGVKGARLTQEVSLPGRFVVLVPNSSTYGISKRLPDDERKRLRKILSEHKPAEHGVIVRTAAEGITADEIVNDVRRLVAMWEEIEALAARSKAPTMLYREPDMAVRVIREEFNKNYRAVVIDDDELYSEIAEYVGGITPALADRVQRYDPAEHGGLPIFEAHNVHEQLHKALDAKVWLPSGGSLIIEKTEALTVIDVNTGKNVGKSSLEETVYKNNLEAAVEIARQLRLRDIGGIIVIDFIDMEVKANRAEVIKTFRAALARDKTRTQVFDISELGLVEMTRKRIGEGLLESYSQTCPACDGRGVVVDDALMSE